MAIIRLITKTERKISQPNVLEISKPYEKRLCSIHNIKHIRIVKNNVFP
jgi:hypothetical protein